MNRFSSSSLQNLNTCVTELQRLFHKVLQYHDCTIIQGHRTEKQHKTYMLEGKTEVPYSKTFHRFNPSRAVDVAPYPIDWNDYRRFYVFAGIVLAVAQDLGYRDYLRWGGNWDRDDSYNDQTFYDLVHWEWRK